MLLAFFNKCQIFCREWPKQLSTRLLEYFIGKRNNCNCRLIEYSDSILRGWQSSTPHTASPIDCDCTVSFYNYNPSALYLQKYF